MKCRSIVLSLLTLLTLVGCGDEGEPGVRLVITTDVAVPASINRLDVSVIGARLAQQPSDEVYETCAPYTRALDLTSAAGDEGNRWYVSILRGEEFDAFLVYRVVASKCNEDDPTAECHEVFSHQGEVGWQSGEQVDEDIRFQFECLQREEPCGEGTQCVDGLCEAIDRYGIFEDETLLAEGAPSCDPMRE